MVAHIQCRTEGCIVEFEAAAILRGGPVRQHRPPLPAGRNIRHYCAFDSSPRFKHDVPWAVSRFETLTGKTRRVNCNQGMSFRIFWKRKSPLEVSPHHWRGRRSDEPRVAETHG